VREHARGARAVLDLGTGGGERLAEMRAELPARLVATEEWHVNAPVARARLAPLGVEAVRATTAALPFRDASFGVVLSRHETIVPDEALRVLGPGGWLLTQQVGMHQWREARPFFERWIDHGDHRTTYAEALRAAGCTVESREHEQRVAYPNIGPFVFMLAVAPWHVPDLDPERDLDALLAMERACTTDDGFVVSECHYLITARKPA